MQVCAAYLSQLPRAAPFFTGAAFNQRHGPVRWKSGVWMTVLAAGKRKEQCAAVPGIARR